jgi:acetyl-CoA C-acetyltransferase
MQAAYLIDGARTPYLKARTGPNPFANSDLAVIAGEALLLRQPFAPTDIENVVIGSTIPDPDEPNIARIVALRLGCGDHVPAWTVMRNCASGLQAIDSAFAQIQLGKNDLMLAGGTDAMSHAPLIFNEDATRWFAEFSMAKTPLDKIKMLGKWRPHFLAPIIAILKGLTDPVCGLNMGQTAENIAYRFGITRAQMDAYSLQSHQRTVAAQAAHYFKEITPLIDFKGRFYTADDGVRPDTTMDKLAKLKPFFDKKFGQVTPGNSSQITDGAAMLIIASAKAVKKYKLPVLAKIVDIQWGALSPEIMGLGPVHAMTPLLQKNHLSIQDIGAWEINEAFAAQVLGCVRAWQDPDYCKEALGLNEPMGEIPNDKLNIDGGAIAIGHPVGSSGARIALHLAHILKRENQRYGVASLCIGGGQGGAILIENVDNVDEVTE